MKQFTALSANIEAKGAGLIAMIEGMGSFKSKAIQILSENGISNLTAEQWYPQQSWLNALRTIAETVGVNTLYSIGMKVPDLAVFPPGIDSIEKALSSLDAAYRLNHRGGKIGYYRYEKTGEKSALMICDNPYPCAFDRGIITALAKKFKPADSLMVQVTHDDSALCRVKGGDSCTYIIVW
jgi:hypothetical protein